MPGCWVAIGYALQGNIGANQFYLPPGNYEVEIDIKCENKLSLGDKKRFEIVSPSTWNQLNITALL
jgi:hypothetical protein